MANYLRLIEEQIARCEHQLAELHAAHRVMSILQETLATNTPEANEKRRITQSKSMRRGHVLKIARKRAMQIINDANAPLRGSEIMQPIIADGAIGESTVWKALKDLRDEGLISWDSETRLYSAVPTNVDRKIAS